MIRISNINNINLKKIKKVLSNSGIIVFPTETVWGIGCKYNDERAIKKIYKIKGRDFSIPLQIQISNINDLKKFCSAPYQGKFKKFCEEALPAPITLVLKKKGIPDYITSGLETVGIRYSSCNELTELIDYLGFPLASTSCNKSGEQVLEDFDEVKEFAEKYADILLELNCKTSNISSTIISYVDENLKLLREGALTFESIIDRMEND